MSAPTQVAYAELQQAFDHFNTTLFNDALSLPLFTLQREKRTFGYHSQKRFVERGTGHMVDEVAMNPSYFAIRSIPQTLSTLVHEMVHQWQFHYGKPGRGNYHNKEWADKMEQVGLMPSNTGEPGGKRTGDRMTHYLIQGGAFQRSCEQLLTRAYTLSWLDRFPPMRPQGTNPSDPDPEGLDDEGDAGEPDAEVTAIFGVVLPPEDQEERSNRQKYICPECSAKAWGKPGLHLWCAGQDNNRHGTVTEHAPLPMGIHTGS